MSHLENIRDSIQTLAREDEKRMSEGIPSMFGQDEEEAHSLLHQCLVTETNPSTIAELFGDLVQLLLPPSQSIHESPESLCVIHAAINDTAERLREAGVLSESIEQVVQVRADFVRRKYASLMSYLGGE